MHRMIGFASALAIACSFSMTSPTAAQAAKPTGVLKIGVGADLETVDPHFTSLPTANAVTRMLFQSLFRLDGQNNITKELATEYSYSADGLTFTVKIQKGQLFSNGEPVDASAVAASFNRLLAKETGSPFRGLFSSIDTVNAVGDAVVEFKLTSRNGHMLPLLANNNAMIVDAKVAKALGPEYGRKPIGSGAYVLTQFVGAERYRLEPNPRYTGADKPKLAAIEWLIAPEDASRMALLETGDVHVVERVPPESIATISALANAKVINPPSMFSINIELVNRGPLADQRVRQALNLAADRKGMIEGVLGGLATESVGMPGPGTQDELRVTFPPIAFDPKKAQALLKEAGYGPGQLKITLTCPQGRYIKDVQVCQAIKGSLDAIGVPTEMQIKDLGSWLKGNAIPPDQRPDNGSMVGRATRGMDYTLYRLFHSKVTTNGSGFKDPRVDELLEAGRATTDEAEQKKIYAEIQTIIWEKAPYIFLWYQKQAIGVARSVEGLEVRPDETMILDNVSLR